jgi:predicted AAA+ superfamily ATPase
MNLSIALNEKIDPQQCILFLDEIQSAPELLSKLRWFSEDLPHLPVIATGSLLEFVLEDHTFSMPVGRVTYMYLEPLSFEEFLLAKNRDFLCQYVREFQYGMETNDFIHTELTSFFKEYIVVGGMPAAVSNWIAEQSRPQVNQIHHDLLSTYRDDFAKYRGRIELWKLDEVMMAIPKMLGQKFIYSKVSSALPTNTIKNTLSLLNKARLCHRVSGSAANGVPLAAEVKEKYFKEIFLDTGLSNAALGINYRKITNDLEILFINKGQIAEQVAGQLLRTIEPFYIEPNLYCWHRDEEGSNAEVDYVIQHGNTVVPIEVKAGRTGSLKSLHLFMGLKNLDTAVRINAQIPTKTRVETKDHTGKKIEYTLLSIPFYLIGQLHRLLDREDESGHRI